MTSRRFRFPALVGNEFLKPLHRVSTYVMLGLVVFAGVVGVVGAALIQRFGAETDANGKPMTDRQVLEATIAGDRASLASNREYLGFLKETRTYPGSEDPAGTPAPTLAPAEFDSLVSSLEESIAWTEQDLAIAQYRLDHGLPADDAKTALGFASQQSWVVELITLLAVVLVSVGVAGEFTGGTIRLLLTRPYRRWKVLLSKYLGTYGVVLAMLCVSMGVAIAGGVLLHGFSTGPYLTYVDGAVRSTPMLLVVLAQFGAACVDLLMISTLAFMIASVFRTSALSIGLSLFLMFAGGVGTTILATVGQLTGSDFLKTVVKFSLFSYTDLSPYLFRSTQFVAPPDVPLGFALAVLCAYYAVFLAVAFVGFAKRDVA